MDYIAQAQENVGMSEYLVSGQGCALTYPLVCHMITAYYVLTVPLLGTRLQNRVPRKGTITYLLPGSSVLLQS
jgi:hypothetical protein